MDHLVLLQDLERGLKARPMQQLPGSLAPVQAAVHLLAASLTRLAVDRVGRFEVRVRSAQLARGLARPAVSNARLPLLEGQAQGQHPSTLTTVGAVVLQAATTGAGAVLLRGHCFQRRCIAAQPARPQLMARSRALLTAENENESESAVSESDRRLVRGATTAMPVAMARATGLLVLVLALAATSTAGPHHRLRLRLLRLA